MCGVQLARPTASVLPAGQGTSVNSWTTPVSTAPVPTEPSVLIRAPWIIRPCTTALVPTASRVSGCQTGDCTGEKQIAMFCELTFHMICPVVDRLTDI